jgi:Response regulator containing a CheY-like receiver domain and a GGDEF domain
VNKRRIVLYADDDIDDKNWVKEACKSLNSSLQIEFVETGRCVLDYLKNNKDGERPSLIVLDLNMPELDGRETLKALKSNSAYKDIPVVIVTTSSNSIDKDVCKRLGASLYLIKPNNYADWQKIVDQFEPYVI